MRRVFEGYEAEATLVGIALEHEGIPCDVRDLPSARVRLRREVVIHHPADFERARVIVTRFEKGAAPSEAVLAEPWQCGACGETVEGQFQACWKCGAARRR